MDTTYMLFMLLLVGCRRKPNEGLGCCLARPLLSFVFESVLADDAAHGVAALFGPWPFFARHLGTGMVRSCGSMQVIQWGFG